MPVHVSSTIVPIIRRSKLYCTASGIITPVGGRPVRRLREDFSLNLRTERPPTESARFNNSQVAFSVGSTISVK